MVEGVRERERERERETINELTVQFYIYIRKIEEGKGKVERLS